MKENVTVDAKEIEHFSQMSESWWDPKGKFRPLHEINPIRLTFIRDHIAKYFDRSTTQPLTFSGLSIADIGCGGGLIAEPFARLGANVAGVDASEKNIAVARAHAKGSGLTVNYLHTTAEGLAAQGQKFDVVLALEIVEHVADVAAFLEAITALVKPGGLLFMSTLNRTVKAYALAIIGAEYVLRWLPRGTHDWNKFLRPSELILPLENLGFQTYDLQGMVFHPISRNWSLTSKDMDVNYLLVAKAR